MSTPSPRVTQRVIDNTLSTPSLPSGIVFVQGITERGPVNDPINLITSWERFQALFGGYISTSDFPLHCKLMLEAGCRLRVNSVKKNALKSTITLENDEGSPDDLVTISSKYPGKAYNELKLVISVPSDSELGDFNLVVKFDGDIVETHENLEVTEESLGSIRSNWVEVTSFEDLTSVTNKVPDFGTFEMEDGSDGDLVADAELSDFSAFDDYEDSYCLLVPDENSQAIHVAGEAYAALRKDLRYYASLATSHDENFIIDDRKTMPTSKYISYTSGGWKITDPVTSQPKNINEVSLFVANFVRVANTEGVWFSFSGPSNVVSRVLSPVNNFGGKAKMGELDQLNRNHINMAINRNGVNMFWGNFTAQRENTHLKFISTHNLVILMGKVLGPTLETFIEKPLDIQLFRQIFLSCEGFMESLVNGRAISEYQWMGDQNASSLADLQVNTAEDIQMGIYKIRLAIVRINPLQEVHLTIELTKAGVTIE